MAVLDYRTPGAPGEQVVRLVEGELSVGERLVWVGRPALPWFALRGVWPCLMGALLVGAGVFWYRHTSQIASEVGGFPAADGPTRVIPMLAFGFSAVGMLLFLSPLWLYLRGRRTAYAVTDQRAMIVRRGLFSGASSESFGPEQLRNMARRHWSMRRGDLIFEEIVLPIGARTAPDEVRRIRRGFLSVDRVAEVEDLIRRTLLEPVTSR